MSKTFLTAFIAMVLTGVVLILSIPPLFDEHQPHQELIAGLSGALSVVLAVVVLTLRAAGRRSYESADAK